MSYDLMDIDINRLNLTDLDMYQCGMQICRPNHSWGPGIRDHFLIHYIFEGEGIFQINNKTYQLQAGDGFLIPPDTITYYQAKRDNPWHYAWIGFNGLKAESYLQQANLTLNNPIFSVTETSFIKECFTKMISTQELIKSREIRLTGLLYIFLSHLIEIRENNSSDNNDIDRTELYIKEIINFIAKNYYRKISITEIADHIGLDRSYMWSIFNEILHTSPQQFLINFRIDKACELMKKKNLSIADISRSVGYQDPLTFSKTFKKIKGIPPSKYRKDLYNK